MALTKIRLGDYIERSTKNNSSLQYGSELIVGVTSEGVFADPKGNPIDVNLKPYKIVNNRAFVYNPSRLDLGSIAYRTEGLCIVSHLYIVFYLNDEGKKIIDPTWLFIYLRRLEFRREVTFRNFGSQRPEFNFNDMSDIIIPLPDITVQQQYVNIYNAMLANQQSYERGLEDLKLVCDGYIEDLCRKMPSEKISPYISRTDIRNYDNASQNVKGVSVYKEFRNPTSKVNTNELSNYKVVKPGEISFVQTTHNEKVFANALNDTDEDILVTSVNEVFYTDTKYLYPEYLRIFLNRTEFDRYARFHSWGTARELFTWDDLCNVKIPIPDIKKQEYIVEIYRAYQLRKKINEKLKTQIKDICPILIRGSLEEGIQSEY